MRDLVALSALPAIWVGYQPAQVADSLAELLSGSLHLEFAYLRLSGQGGAAPLEVARAGGRQAEAGHAERIGRALLGWLQGPFTNAPRAIPNPVGEGTVTVLLVPLGWAGEEGVLAVGSAQPGFPAEEDRLLLSVGANQAAAVLQRQRVEESQKRLQRERDELLARLQLQFERMPLACILIDPQHRVFEWNPAAERIFGHKREEALGRDGCDLLLAPANRPRGLGIIRRLLAGDMTAHDVGDNVTKDGRVIVCEWHNTPLLDAEGKVFAILSMANDITERQRAEQALRRSEERLAADLAGMARLQQVSTQLVKAGDGPLLQEIVDAAIAVTSADMGNVQLLDRDSGTLKIVASRGFNREMLVPADSTIVKANA